MSCRSGGSRLGNVTADMEYFVRFVVVNSDEFAIDGR